MLCSAYAQAVDPPLAAAIAGIWAVTWCGDVDVKSLLITRKIPETPQQDAGKSYLDAEEAAFALAADGVSVDDDHGSFVGNSRLNKAAGDNARRSSVAGLKVYRSRVSSAAFALPVPAQSGHLRK